MSLYSSKFALTVMNVALRFTLKTSAHLIIYPLSSFSHFVVFLLDIICALPKYSLFAFFLAGAKAAAEEKETKGGAFFKALKQAGTPSTTPSSTTATSGSRSAAGSGASVKPAAGQRKGAVAAKKVHFRLTSETLLFSLSSS